MDDPDSFCVFDYFKIIAHSLLVSAEYEYQQNAIK